MLESLQNNMPVQKLVKKVTFKLALFGHMCAHTTLDCTHVLSRVKKVWEKISVEDEK